MVESVTLPGNHQRVAVVEETVEDRCPVSTAALSACSLTVPLFRAKRRVMGAPATGHDRDYAGSWGHPTGIFAGSGGSSRRSDQHLRQLRPPTARVADGRRPMSYRELVMIDVK